MSSYRCRPLDTTTLDGRQEEARIFAAHPRVRALLEEANREIADGKTVPAEELGRALRLDEPSYDVEGDALYVPLSDRLFGREEQLDARRRVAYSEDSTPVAVEIRRASAGILLDGLPEPERIAAQARRFGLPVLPFSERVAAEEA